MKADDEEKVPVAEYHPYKRHFFVFRMSERAWLEVKPEATVALEKIIGEHIPWNECAATDSLVVIDSELSHRRKATTPSQDSHQVGARITIGAQLLVYRLTSLSRLHSVRFLLLWNTGSVISASETNRNHLLRLCVAWNVAYF